MQYVLCIKYLACFTTCHLTKPVSLNIYNEFINLIINPYVPQIRGASHISLRQLARRMDDLALKTEHRESGGTLSPGNPEDKEVILIGLNRQPHAAHRAND